MTTNRLLKIPTLLIFLSITLFGCDSTNQNRIYQQSSHDNFEDTLQNLDIAISEHNYRIIHRSNIGQAIRDRGDELYPLSTVISFCNITYAKEMMEINSDLINDMPCIITVREDTQGTIIGTRLMSENSNNLDQTNFSKRINANLKSIIQSSIE